MAKEEKQQMPEKMPIGRQKAIKRTNESREERLARQLRENLRRRKEQARNRDI